MTHAVRVETDIACVDRWHARDGAAIGPGTKIADVMGPDGMVHTVNAESWGILVISDRGVHNEEYDNAISMPENDNEDAFAHHKAPVNVWSLVAHMLGLKSFYKGGDELGAEKSLLSSAQSISNKVYARGALLFQIMPHDKRGTAKSATPHPSTSRSVSNAKATGALLPTFG